MNLLRFWNVNSWKRKSKGRRQSRVARASFLDPIRKDPAFLQFMAEMKTRWEGYQREFG